MIESPQPTKKEKYAAWYAANRSAQLERMRVWREANRDTQNVMTSVRNTATRNANPAQAMVIASRTRAKTKGMAHTITAADVIIPDLCPMLGIPLALSVGAPSNSSPSLDRIDSSKGYIPGNVWVLSHKANSMKRDATREELLTFAYYIIDNFDKASHE